MRDEHDDNRYDEDDDWHRRPRRRRKRPHSGPGIASLVLAILSGTVICASVVAGAILDSRATSDDDSRYGRLACFFLLAGGLAVIGLVLGIVGMLTQRRKRLFAGIGLGFNACIVLGILLLVVIGLLT